MSPPLAISEPNKASSKCFPIIAAKTCQTSTRCKAGNRAIHFFLCPIFLFLQLFLLIHGVSSAPTNLRIISSQSNFKPCIHDASKQTLVCNLMVAKETGDPPIKFVNENPAHQITALTLNVGSLSLQSDSFAAVQASLTTLEIIATMLHIQTTAGPVISWNSLGSLRRLKLSGRGAIELLLMSGATSGVSQSVQSLALENANLEKLSKQTLERFPRLTNLQLNRLTADSVTSDFLDGIKLETLSLIRIDLSSDAPIMRQSRMWFKSQAATLQILDLVNNGITELPWFLQEGDDSSTILTNLRNLTIRNPIDWITKLSPPNLRNLQLVNVQDMFEACLVALSPRLEALHVQNMKIGLRLSTGKTRMEMRQLRELQLINTNTRSLSSIRFSKTLTYLRLSYQNIEAAPEIQSDTFAAVTQLRSLILTQLLFTQQSPHWGTALKEMAPGLTKVYISNVKFQQDAMAWLLWDLIGRMRSVVTLNLHLMKLGALPNDATIFQNLGKLSVLNLRNNAIRSVSARIFLPLARRPPLSTLVDINLSKNNLSDVSYCAFREFQLTRKLASLNLLENPIVCDARLRWLTQWLASSNTTPTEKYPNLNFQCARDAPNANRKFLSLSTSDLPAIAGGEGSGQSYTPCKPEVLLASVAYPIHFQFNVVPDKTASQVVNSYRVALINLDATQRYTFLFTEFQIEYSAQSLTQHHEALHHKASSTDQKRIRMSPILLEQQDKNSIIPLPFKLETSTLYTVCVDLLWRGGELRYSNPSLNCRQFTVGNKSSSYNGTVVITIPHNKEKDEKGDSAHSSHHVTSLSPNGNEGNGGNTKTQIMYIVIPTVLIALVVIIVAVVLILRNCLHSKRLLKENGVAGSKHRMMMQDAYEFGGNEETEDEVYEEGGGYGEYEGISDQTQASSKHGTLMMGSRLGGSSGGGGNDSISVSGGLNPYAASVGNLNRVSLGGGGVNTTESDVMTTTTTMPHRKWRPFSKNMAKSQECLSSLRVSERRPSVTNQRVPSSLFKGVGKKVQNTLDTRKYNKNQKQQQLPSQQRVSRRNVPSNSLSHAQLQQQVNFYQSQLLLHQQHYQQQQQQQQQLLHHRGSVHSMGYNAAFDMSGGEGFGFAARNSSQTSFPPPNRELPAPPTAEEELEMEMRRKIHEEIYYEQVSNEDPEDQKDEQNEENDDEDDDEQFESVDEDDGNNYDDDNDDENDQTADKKKISNSSSGGKVQTNNNLEENSVK